MKRAAHMARNLRWEVWMKPLKLDACPFAFHYHPNRISVATNLIHFGIKMTRYLMFTNVYLASLKRCETEQNQDTLWFISIIHLSSFCQKYLCRSSAQTAQPKIICWLLKNFVDEFFRTTFAKVKDDTFGLALIWKTSIFYSVKLRNLETARFLGNALDF